MPETVLLEQQLLSNKITLNSQYFKFIMMLNSFKVSKAIANAKADAHKNDGSRSHEIQWFCPYFGTKIVFDDILNRTYVGVSLNFDSCTYFLHFSHLIISSKQKKCFVGDAFSFNHGYLMAAEITEKNCHKYFLIFYLVSFIPVNGACGQY